MTFRVEYEHRDELRRAALTEFTERGYDAASLNRILGASQMSKGQLYYHFAGKEALFLALVEWMIDEKVRWLADHPPELAGEDFFAVLAASVRSRSSSRAPARSSRSSRRPCSPNGAVPCSTL